MTVESGRRIESDLRQVFSQAGQPLDNVMVTSLAGGYTGYVTTPEEYGRQYYEGGHTIYGKHTLPYLRAHEKQLASDMILASKPLIELPERWQYRFEKKDFLTERGGDDVSREEVTPPVYYHAKANEEGHWVFHWRDALPGNMAFHEPLLSIETRKKGETQWRTLEIDGVPVNDQGYDMAVRLLNTDAKKTSLYAGYWFNPIFRGEEFEYRFVVAARRERPVLYSSPFY